MKSGYLSLSQAQKHLGRVDKTVKIRAIIYQNADWFEQPLSNTPTVSLLTLNESFDKIGGKSHYARVMMERQEKAELPLENELNQIAKQLPNMNLPSRAAEIEAYHSSHFLLSFSSHVFWLFSRCPPSRFCAARAGTRYSPTNAGTPCRTQTGSSPGNFRGCFSQNP